MFGFIVYPDQLFKINNLSIKPDIFILIEEPLYFSQYRFHKHKLILHRASLQYYKSYLEKNHKQVLYLSFEQASKQQLIKIFQDYSIDRLSAYRIYDDFLQRKTEKIAKELKIVINYLESPGFINNFDESVMMLGENIFFTNFYIAQRKKHKILVNQNSPIGSRWTFDTENRKKIPAKLKIPESIILKNNQYKVEAINYVEQNFPNNPGESENFNYAVTHQEAELVWQFFLQEKIFNYGSYQDSISEQTDTLFHSVISPYLNNGLLRASEVLDQVLMTKAELNSIEGFVRQVLGWREFIRAIYQREGVKIRNSNFFNSQNILADTWYSGTTGIIPVDQAIKKTIRTSYAHHIERLMLIGNLMLLTGIKPDQVYQWFMELYIDAYDWVMVPNVYSMSQYTDGGLITTKPYLCSSNYILKMSNYQNGQWSEILTALYWNFLAIHSEKLSSNPRLIYSFSNLKKMSPVKLSGYKQQASTFINKNINSLRN